MMNDLEKKLTNTAFILYYEVMSWVVAIEENEEIENIRKDLVVVLLNKIIEDLEKINKLAKENWPEAYGDLI